MKHPEIGFVSANRFLGRLTVAILLWLPCSLAQEPQRQSKEPSAIEPLLPLGPPPPLDKRMLELGRKLFHEERLSGDRSVSCSTCHSLKSGGMDGRTVSIGINSQAGNRNAPTVYNSSLNFLQFWDGRAETLEEQALQAIANPLEMGADWPSVMQRLAEIPSYASDFKVLFRDGITGHNIARAIADFERTLITSGARFDRYLQGETEAIRPIEKEGYRLFKEYGCSSCHQGRGIGGNLFSKLGVMHPCQKGPDADPGRFLITQQAKDKFIFKVPSLRNISLTAPYMHDGSVPNLKEVVVLMGWHQLGRTIQPKHVDLLVAFMDTLTGLHPELSK